MLPAIDPLIAAGVVLATAATDAVYVMFTSAVVAKRRVPAASWSSLWYMLSSFAVISYTNNWVYCAVRGGGLVDRRLCLDDVSARRRGQPFAAARARGVSAARFVIPAKAGIQ
jgi:hypothetical protein